VVLALVLGVVAALLTARAATGDAPARVLVVAREDIAAGTLLGGPASERLLALAAVPAGFHLPGLIGDPDEVAGRRTAAPLAAGEPVTQAALGGSPGLGPAPLAPGERAVPVPLAAAGGAAAALRPGSRVDVVASSGEGPAGRSAVVVSDAEVLATDDVLAVDGGGFGMASAMLRVTPAQALRVTEALNFARDVRLLVRPVMASRPRGARGSR
jgi:Flp pilus assembly protein CpaB